jgi:hypothetical protein
LVIKSIFNRGYNLTEADRDFYTGLFKNDRDKMNELIIFSFCNNLSDRELVDSVFTHSKRLLIIESARRNEIVGFNCGPDEWIAFANNAIQYHSEYWEYIELAFKDYGLWDKLIKLDKKKTFQNKVQSFYLKMPEQKFDFDEVFQDLYPERYI